MIASTTRKNKEVDFQDLKTPFFKDGRFILPVSVSLSLSTDKARIIIGWVGDLLVVNYEWSEIPPPTPPSRKEVMEPSTEMTFHIICQNQYF